MLGCNMTQTIVKSNKGLNAEATRPSLLLYSVLPVHCYCFHLGFEMNTMNFTYVINQLVPSIGQK